MDRNSHTNYISRCRALNLTFLRNYTYLLRQTYVLTRRLTYKNKSNILTGRKRKTKPRKINLCAEFVKHILYSVPSLPHNIISVRQSVHNAMGEI